MISKKSISLLIASVFFLSFHSFSLAQQPDLFEIEIDADKGTISVNLSEDEVKKRKSEWKPKNSNFEIR